MIGETEIRKLVLELKPDIVILVFFARNLTLQSSLTWQKMVRSVIYLGNKFDQKFFSKNISIWSKTLCLIKNSLSCFTYLHFTFSVFLFPRSSFAGGSSSLGAMICAYPLSLRGLSTGSTVSLLLRRDHLTYSHNELL